MPILSKSLQAYFLISSIFLLAAGYWWELYWTIYVVALGLSCCLVFGTKEASDKELKRLSDLDFYFRFLHAAPLLIVLFGLAFRSDNRAIQASCVLVFFLYYFTY